MSSPKTAKKYCVAAENAHIGTTNLQIDTFNDVYQDLQNLKVMQTISKITLSQMNDKLLTR